MSYFKYPIPTVASLSGTGLATEAKQDTMISLLGGNIDVVDQIDTTPWLDTSSTNIPASSGSPVEVVASLAADVTKLYSVDDIGAAIGVYTGAAAAEVLKCILPLGGCEDPINVDISSGTRISLRAMENTAITSGHIGINFIG